MPDRAALSAWCRRGQRGVAIALAAVAACSLSSAAHAQDRDIERRIESRLRRSTDQIQISRSNSLSLSEKTTLDVGGFQAFTYLSLDDSEGNNRGLLQNDTTLYARASVEGVHTFFARLRFRHQNFTPGDSFDERGDRWREPYLDRYWYELNARDLISPSDSLDGGPTEGGLDLNLRVGRQFVDWGSGLALSEVLLSVRPTLTLSNKLSIEGLIGVTPPDESVIDFDASRVQYNLRTKRGYFGALMRGQTDWGGELYASILWSTDYNDDNESRFPGLGPVEFDYNPIYLGFGTSGSIGTNFLYQGEFVFEGGQGQSDPLRGPQARESIRAFAARAELTYLLRDEGQTRLQAEALLASGDRDRLSPTDTVGGNLAGTDDNAFNALGFANTGLAFGGTLNNLISLRLGASTFPFRAHRELSQFQVGADLFVFSKFDEDAPIDEPTYARSFLGVETDLYLNYRITSDLGLNVRYGAFIPGSAISGERDTRHFILFSVTLSF